MVWQMYMNKKHRYFAFLFMEAGSDTKLDKRKLNLPPVSSDATEAFSVK